MGKVYLGVAGSTGGKVAIKVLSVRGDGSQERLEKRFFREAKLAANLRHPHVVRVFDSGVHDLRPYIVMELVEGASLGDILDQRDRLDPERVANLGAAVAEGLTAIHEAGIVHRDIKPDNILLGTGSQVKITDMGLSRVVEDETEGSRLTATGVVVGTPLYVAPEAIRDTKNAGPAADVYSLGATLYHAASGQPPFDGDSPYDLMRGHLDETATPLHELVEGIPENLDRTIMRCLEKDPRRRPSAERLARLLRGEITVASDSAKSRNWAPLVLVATGLVLAVAIGLWFAIRPGGRPGRVNLAGLPPGAHLSIDGGEWRPGRDLLELPPNEHDLRVAHLGPDGRRLSWNARVTVDAGDEITLEPELVPAATRQDLEEVPGEGLILCQGSAVALGPPLSFEAVGVYRVSRWSGGSARSALVRVEFTDLTTESWVESDLPHRDAYFARHFRSRPAPAHHVVCWEELRSVAGAGEMIPADVDPLAPADALDPAAVRIWQATMKGYARLPDRRVADELGALLEIPCWRHHDGKVVGPASSPGPSLLVAVPDEE